ncbi:MAG TPA: peptidyl-prolyl cis-trans isomerase [Anaeromyxobacteraceae bacterium]|nr:peptidyl-prolyl cis-trans isomerase [Anaeromyxobacteraceae bacterium]
MLRRSSLPALLALGAALAGGCRGRDKPAAAPVTVAVVNGEPISVASLRRELGQFRLEASEGSAPADLLRQSVLDDLVARALLLQQARARGIAVGDEQVERAFLALRAEYPGTAFDDLLAQEKLSAAELRSRLRDQLTVEKLFQDEVFPRVEVSDEEIARWYAEHPGALDEPDRVRASQIVVRTREEALKIRDELRRKPQTFAEVARRASIGPEGKNGGDLGYFSKGGGMPEVFDVCFRLPLNAVSDVVPSPYGFHLFRVVERKAAAKRTLEQVRPVLAQRLLREKRARAQEAYVAALRAKATIQVDPAALASVKP